MNKNNLLAGPPRASATSTREKYSLYSYDDLLSRLYDSASSHEGFTPFLAACCEYFEAKTGILFVVDVESRKGRIGWSYGYPPGLVNLLIKAGAHQYDDGLNRALREQSDSIYSFSEGNENYKIGTDLSSLTKQWARALGIRDIATFTFDVNPGERYILIFNRCKDQGLFNSNDLEFLNLLAPHVKRAVNFYDTIFCHRQLDEQFTTLLDSLSYPLILFSMNGRLLSISKDMVSLNDKYGLFEIKDDCIQFTDQALHIEFQDLLLLYLSETGEKLIGTESLFVPTEGNPLRVTMRPLLEKNDKLSGLLLEIKDSNQVQYPSQKAIRAIIDASAAESRVIERLLQGEDIKTIAKKINLSEHTVRSYLKSVMEKNGFRRQLEIVSTLLKVIC